MRSKRGVCVLGRRKKKGRVKKATKINRIRLDTAKGLYTPRPKLCSPTVLYRLRNTREETPKRLCKIKTRRKLRLRLYAVDMDTAKRLKRSI